MVRRGASEPNPGGSVPKEIEDLTERYAAYAAAFEIAIVDDDWTRIEPFFTKDVEIRFHTPPFRGGCKGLDGIADYFREMLDGFDRRFDERAVTEPLKFRQQGTMVEMAWNAAFRIEGVPDLILSGVEQARFRGQHIYKLDGRFTEEGKRNCDAWMPVHFEKLHPKVEDITTALLAAAKGELH